MDNNSQIPEISGKFQRCDQKNGPRKIYIKNLMTDLLYGKFENLNSHIIPNNNRQKEKEIAKRRAARKRIKEQKKHNK